LQAAAEHLVIAGTAQPARGPKLHILYPARRTGQSRQLVIQRPDVLAEQVLHNRRQVQLLLLSELLFLGAGLGQVEFFLLAAFLEIGQVNGRRIGAKLAFHAAFLPERARAADAWGQGKTGVPRWPCSLSPPPLLQLSSSLRIRSRSKAAS